MMEYAVQTRELTRWYGRRRDQPAISAINLAVQPGCLFGLVGPDGAGKTTLLRMLASVIPPSSGSAAVAGCDIRRAAAQIHRLIGYMPQNFSLYPDLTVRENLNFFAEIHGVARQQKEQRIGEMLSFSRLERFQTRRAGQLSGGMKKKLALACALVHDPKLLILDEPSTGVDPVSRRELWLILAQVAQQGVTVLVSTPYMDEAERCHQVAMLYQGRLLVSGNPAELMSSLPFDVIEVKSRPRKRMRETVASIDGILQWRPVGDRLRLSVDRQNGRAAQVMETLDSALRLDRQEVRLLRLVSPDMEDVFVYLVEQQRGAR